MAPLLISVAGQFQLSLCLLRVLSVYVVEKGAENIPHGDTENTEVHRDFSKLTKCLVSDRTFLKSYKNTLVGEHGGCGGFQIKPLPVLEKSRGKHKSGLRSLRIN